MNSADYAKELAFDQNSPGTNEWKARTPSASLDFKISLNTEEKKFATPWLYVRSNLKIRIPIGHASPSLVAKYSTQAMSSLTVSCLVAIRTLYNLTQKTFISKPQWSNPSMCA